MERSGPARMQMDFVRLTDPVAAAQLEPKFAELLEAYDQGGLPYERALVRLSFARWLLAQGDGKRAAECQRGDAGIGGATWDACGGGGWAMLAHRFGGEEVNGSRNRPTLNWAIRGYPFRKSTPYQIRLFACQRSKCFIANRVQE